MAASRLAPLRRLLAGPRGWFLAALVALLAGELALRAAGFGGALLSQASARYGWRIVGGQAVVHERTGIAVETNELGFRDREFGSPPADASDPRAPASGEARVAWLGNSMVWGGGHVALERRCDRELETRLNRRLRQLAPARGVRSLNFAQPGYTFEQMARVWEDLVRPYRPAVLIVPLTCYDVRPMWPSYDRARYPFWRTLESSALFDAYQRVRGGGWRPEVDAERSALESALAADPFAPEHAALWSALEERLESLIARARADGTRVVVVALPLLEDLIERDRRWFGERWAAWCAAREVDFVDPLPRFRVAMQPLLAELAGRGTAPQSLWRRDGDPSAPFELDARLANCFLFDDPQHYTPRGHYALADALLEPVLRALAP